MTNSPPTSTLYNLHLSITGSEGYSSAVADDAEPKEALRAEIKAANYYGVIPYDISEKEINYKAQIQIGKLKSF